MSHLSEYYPDELQVGCGTESKARLKHVLAHSALGLGRLLPLDAVQREVLRESLRPKDKVRE